MKYLAFKSRNRLLIMIGLVLCIVDNSFPSLIEQLGKDIQSIQRDFKKGYAQL